MGVKKTHDTNKYSGGDIRAALIDLGLIYQNVLFVPSAATIAKHVGISGASGLVAIGKRIGANSSQEVLEKATGLPVTPVAGFLVELTGEHAAASEEEAQPITLGGALPVTITDLAQPEQAQALATEIVDRLTPPQALAFAQRLLGTLATSITEDYPG